MSRAFIRGRSLHVRGHVWYCQSPGVRWAMDPALGYALFYTDGPSWWLVGNGAEVDMGTTRLKEAMVHAADHIGRLAEDED